MSNDQPNNPQPDDSGMPSDPYATPPGEGQVPPGYQQPPPYGQPAAYGQPPAFDPAAGGYGQPPEPPKSLTNAVILMWVGAGIAALSLLALFFTDRDAAVDQLLSTDGLEMSQSEAESAVDLFTNFTIAIGILSIGLWVLMAVMNRRGKSWARIMATILGGLNIVFTLFSFSQPTSTVNMVMNILNVVLAAAILFLLYRPESSEYYAAQSRQRL